MQGRHGFSKVAALSICVILLLLLAEVPEQEPFGLHLDSDGKRVLLSESDVETDQIGFAGSDHEMIRNPLDERVSIAIVAMLMLSSPSPCRSKPVDAHRSPPDGAGPKSTIVQRI